MDLVDPLREVLVAALSQGTWTEIKADHARVKLGWREDLEPGWGKPKYVRAVLAELDDSEVVALGDRCLRAFPGRTAIRLQDALWWIECRGVSRVTPITRRALADAMDGHRLHPDLSPGEFLAQHAAPIGSWGGVPEAGYAADGTLTRPPVTDPFSFLGIGESAAPHEPVGHHWLFERFGYLSWPDKRLFRVLEALVHPTTRRGAEQSTWVERIDEVLAVDGFEVRETEQLSGHPAFRIEPRRRGGHRRPKNLIFASTGLKPELGFSDALDNDVVILGNADTCLFYDDPVGDDGLTWSTLVGWWARNQGLDPTLPETRKALGERLLASVGSPPERRLFASYFRRYAEKLGDRLPALLPQVYLHYDPATLRQLRRRGLERRFLAQRMDFLMLLPRGVRVVLEVDGQQHYSTGMSADAKPSPSVYAETVRADRDLRLAGYEVYRFGGAELGPKATEATVQAFFDALLGGLLGDG